ncbi:MAG: glycosyltransferase [Vagococcus sp.]|nr:glycosyltransferase [Vagococcus sp.]
MTLKPSMGNTAKQTTQKDIFSTPTRNIPKTTPTFFLRKAAWHLRYEGPAGLKKFLRNQKVLPSTSSPISRPHVLTSLVRRGASRYQPWQPPRTSPRRNLMAGVILDDFSALAFSFEWNQMPLHPDNWRNQVRETPMDILFVESAWHGNNALWRYRLSNNTPSKKLLDIITWCNDHGIPTVFWNKEDPVHFDDFINTAKLFDHIYTTDADMIPKYKQHIAHENVSLMPFAAQTAIHYPHLVNNPAPRDVAFAGMYFAHKYPERRTQMDLLLTGAMNASKHMNHGLDIFSRQLGGDKRYQFPKPFSKYVIGSLSYEKMLSAYRAYKVFLNVNSVTNSQTMCARRIFELGACGIPVVSTPSPAISHFFSEDEVVQVTSAVDAEYWLRAFVRSSLLREMHAYKTHMKILKNHTYTQRVNNILSDCRLGNYNWSLPDISILLSTNRPDNLPTALDNCARQNHIDTQIIIGTHGFSPSSSVQQHAHSLGLDVAWVELDSSFSLGSCYNHLLEYADCPLIAKMDDDDWYAPEYLLEQVSAMDSLQVDAVGKNTHLISFPHRHLTALYAPGHSHIYTRFVAGPTIVTKADLAKDLSFPDITVGEDSQFLQRIHQNGGVIFSTSPFGFIRNRGLTGHTFEQADARFLANAHILPN